MRRFLRAIVPLTFAAVAASVGQAQTRGAAATAPLKAGELRLTYLGNAGWEITDGKKIVLVDPFLTQFARWTPKGPAPEVGPNDPYPADTALINAHVKKADYIVITHGHPDHALDAGYISKRTGAVIIGHETAANLARAYDVPDSNIITVVGGEDYELLFTISQSDYDKIKDESEIRVIGYTTESAGIVELITKGNNKVKIDADGWKAFNN